MGVLFEYDYVTSTFVKKVDFVGSNGRYPYGSLMQASNGKLYGMTSAGGVSNVGVLFEYNITSSAYAVRFNFGGSFGNNPYGELTEMSGGKLYGMTPSGGSAFGTLFHFDTTTYVGTLDVTFTGGVNGMQPFGSLILATDSNLYGMTRLGGVSNSGILFQYNTSSGLTKKFDFNGAGIQGGGPYGTPMQASNGKLYGMTYTGGGGYGASGALYEYDIPTSILTTKLSFAGNSRGATPSGSLLKAANGKVYGMTAWGGINGLGMLFEYDPTTSIYIDKYNFNGVDGANPNGSLKLYLSI